MQIRRPKTGLTQKRFVRLMDFYEQNYLLLRKLIPHIHKIEGKAVSVRRNSVDLHMEVIEREKFTTTILLTHHFKAANKILSKPDFIVRIYHDARSVEVLSAALQGKRVKLSQSRVGVKERYRLNRFLHKWLYYLLKQGHVLRSPAKLEPFK